MVRVNNGVALDISELKKSAELVLEGKKLG